MNCVLQLFKVSSQTLHSAVLNANEQLWHQYDFFAAFPVSVQNGSLHQKDTVHDNDFEPYLTGQSNQVGNTSESLKYLVIHCSVALTNDLSSVL